MARLAALTALASVMLCDAFHRAHRRSTHAYEYICTALPVPVVSICQTVGLRRDPQLCNHPQPPLRSKAHSATQNPARERHLTGKQPPPPPPTPRGGHAHGLAKSSSLPQHGRRAASAAPGSLAGGLGAEEEAEEAFMRSMMPTRKVGLPGLLQNTDTREGA